LRYKKPYLRSSGALELSHTPHRVSVSVPARLHLGFLDLNGGLGRKFGSIGLAISGLQTRISVTAAQQMQVSGPESDRARAYVERLQNVQGLSGPHHVHISETIPSHAGLGSGTQLALALAAGIRRLHGLPLDIREDAVRLGRGARSGIGIGLFDMGGVIVDGGRRAETRPAPIVSRIPFPEAWRIVLVLDRTRTGIHGEDERAAFARLPLFAADDAAHICRLVLMQALPALAEADLVSFAEAIKKMQAVLGAYFAPLQGGRPFASPDVAGALDLLEEQGALGAGQSSWGPTGFAFARSRDEADRLVEFASGHPRCRGLDIRTCKGLNHGAEINADAIAAMPDP
jgi:beta-ribofuranosylaminobenzene 5'-phosphate synthase